MVVIGTVKDIVRDVINPPIVKISLGGAALFQKPMEVVREIIRQKKKGLQIYTLIGDMDIDLLIGAGVVTDIHSSYISIPMVGMAKNFRRVIESGSGVIFHEWTELSMIRAFQAGAIGIPAIILRSLLGSDLVKIREDFMEVMHEGLSYIQVPAITTDLAIVHAWKADENGNIFYPKLHVLDEFSILPARCAKKLFVSVEEVISNKEGRKLIAKGHETIFSPMDVDYIAEMPKGAWPSGFLPFYASDMDHYMTYSLMSQTPESFESYLQEYILKRSEEDK